MTESTESRRVPYGAWIEQPNSEIRDFFLAHSLSPVGLRLFAEDPPRLGQEVQLRLLVENEQRVLQLGGEIVGHEFAEHERPSFAVRFTSLAEQDRDFLSSLFDETLYGPGRLAAEEPEDPPARRSSLEASTLDEALRGALDEALDGGLDLALAQALDEAL